MNNKNSIPVYDLSSLPIRTKKNREYGLTMVLDKGLGLYRAQDLVDTCSQYIDIVKLGWGTAHVTPESILKKKIKLYQEANIPVYLGGTYFEAHIHSRKFDDYRRLLDKYNLQHVEVSDGSLEINHNEKCGYIRSLCKDYKVLSEVGSKDDAKIIPPYRWIEFMQAELEAGAWKVIGESREKGNVGLFRGSGEVRQGLVEEILTKIGYKDIIWEAPQKSQQVHFVGLNGVNVNLGNIEPNEVIPLETLRLGLRGDTFLKVETPKKYM